VNRYALRTGEALAISADAIHRDADGFFLLLGGSPPENETLGSVTMVNIRGALQQFEGPGGDSYESIVKRVSAAFEADPRPSAVVLRISSPGGVVAGLNECVKKLQRMSKEASIPLIAYADELAASAAYAMCCACSEILAPPSGIVGSIGVIATMISIAKRDERDGIEFRLITSGKRKADGHLHAPISDDAEKAERARNVDMAAQFFALAGKARRVAPAKLEALEAGIYMGKKAKAAGLIDDVMSLDRVLFGLDTSEVSAGVPPAPNEGNITDRRANEKNLLTSSTDSRQRSLTLTSVSVRGDRLMAVKLAALIKTTEAAISTETDPKKLRALRADLAAFSATRAAMEDDDDGDEDDKDKDDDEDEDESKASKAAEAARKAKAKAESAKHRAKAAEHKSKAAEYEEAAKKCEEEASGGEGGDEGEAEEARLRTPISGDAAEILASEAAAGREALTRVERLEAKALERDRLATISKLVAERRVSPAEAKRWAKKDSKFWAQVEEMRTHALVNTVDDDLESPDQTPNADLPAAVLKQIDIAVQSCGLDVAGQEKLRTELVDENRKARMNGAGKMA
jgi:ClpP class serine protease